MRHTAKLATAFFAALVSLSFSGCNSDDAGETLKIGLEDVGLVLLAESISDEPITPTKYQGTSTVTAQVAYRGKKELGYQWTVFPPGAVGGEITPADETLEIKATAVATGFEQPDLGDGGGTIRLTVDEKGGVLAKTVECKLIVIASNGG